MPIAGSAALCAGDCAGVFCCSPPARTTSAMERFQIECAAGIARAGRRARPEPAVGAGPDHPVHPLLPEPPTSKLSCTRWNKDTQVVDSFLPQRGEGCPKAGGEVIARATPPSASLRSAPPRWDNPLSRVRV